jgi:hypothetical protein
VRGIEKLQTAELHERNVAAGEFDFQRTAMRGRSEEHRLLLEQGSFLAGFEDPVDNVVRLIGLITHGDQARLYR